MHREWMSLRLAKPRAKSWGSKKRKSDEVSSKCGESSSKEEGGLNCYPSTNIVFFDGMAPGPSHTVWSTKELQVVVWWKSRPSAGPPASEEWSTTRMRMDHGILGGVTTRVDWLYITTKTTSTGVTNAAFENWWDGAVDTGLKFTSVRGIIDHTLHGRVKASEDNKTSLMNRKLDWKRDKSALHVLPSVFSPTGLVCRRLGVRELSLALDFPSILSKHAPEDDLERWVEQVGPPFKSRVQVVHLIRRFLTQPRDSTGDRNRPNLKKTSSSNKEKPGMKEWDEPSTLDDMDPSLIVELSDEIKDEDRNLKATKADDAEIPYHLWNDRILAKFGVQSFTDTQRKIKALASIRKGALIYWKRKVANDFWTWWRLHKKQLDGQEQKASLDAGLSAMQHVSLSSWWDWDAGSSPFFWRMPDRVWHVEMRDGVKPMWIGRPPRYRIPQRNNPDETSRGLEKKKISKVRSRGYIAPHAGILSLTSFFSVPKGPTDIRMVYDGTKSGLNAVLHAPWFSLATVDSMLRSVDVSTWSADNDFGEMFLNFWIHPEIRKYTGVDLTAMFAEEIDNKAGQKRKWEAWVRCAMGITVSPYQTTQCSQRVKRVIFGCRFDKKNIFRWARVEINLPGSREYDSSKPWICKVREDGQIAVDIHTYVDDLRGTAPSREEAWLASSAMAKGAAFFGLQDAARKRRPPSQTPGAWAGAVVETTGDAVYKTVSAERWKKTKGHVQRLVEWAAKEEEIDRKELERIRGFLVYVSLTFQSMVPYLKGIHLTLESWRPDRNEDGWRLPPKEREAVLAEESNKAIAFGPAPSKVKKAKRFNDDVEALANLTAGDTPPRLLARPRKGSQVVIIFGDASGEGFGTSLWLYGSDEVDTEHGLWTREYGARSSNFRELYNLILRLEALVTSGRLKVGTEVFLFTDNSTSESAFYRGTSSSRLLFELVLRARKLEMNGNVFLRVVWVAGTRMIDQGTDGLSRGDLLTGVMAGDSMLFYVPLHKSSEERFPGAIDWLLQYTGGLQWKKLTPQQWFDEAFERGCFVWNPPPAIADVALDLMCDSHHIHPDNSHIFVCPALMSNRWRKKLGKIADIVFTIPVDCCLWSKDQHEPLIVAFVHAHLFHRPWQVSRARHVLDAVHDGLSKVWSSDSPIDGHCLRQFWMYTGY